MQPAAVEEFAGTDRFQVLRCLGAGGMGVVYEVFDRQRHIVLALKTLRSLDAEALLHFKNEFRALRDVHHTNLVGLDELIEEQGRWFFTMELIEGVHLLEYIRGDRMRSQPGDPAMAATLRTAPTPTPRPAATGALALPCAEGEGEGRGAFGPEETPPSVMVPRSGGRCDEGRLRRCFSQLAQGLFALHEARKVHRDIKSSNILVTRAGRVVILDFGVIVDAEPRIGSGDQSIVGTSSYVAPEQAAGHAVGPPADWYSVGVLLYRALTGRMPFDGTPEQVVTSKLRREPPPPSALTTDVPPDLDALCADLLRRRPRARPSGREVLERLAVDGVVVANLVQAPFVGRRAELKLLEEAFDEAVAGRTVALQIEGESGLGKSALVRHFIGALARRSPDLVVLEGRCHQAESVPYKGLDGVIDSLSRHLAVGTGEELPDGVTLLAQIFPVLRHVDAVARAPRPAHDIIDVKELRARAFAVLRELLRGLGQRRPLLVVIEDLQWADADSLALLGEALRPPNAPRLLLLSTVRDRASASPPGVEMRRLALERLAPAEAHLLARSLLENLPSNRSVDAAGIADEAAGHPLFIDALVRHAAAADPTSAGPVRLEDALWWSIGGLDPPARRLMDLVALSGVPLVEELALRAAEVGPADAAVLVSRLRNAHLLRTTPGDDVEPYHDRVRQAILAHLGDETLRQHHRRLATVLEEWTGADPEALAIHWRGAGEPMRASRHAAAAGARAATALAFDRAARHYRTALTLWTATTDEERADRRALAARLGEALMNAGRAGEAAIAFREAADGAPPEVAFDHERCAAELLMQSGRIDEGLTAIRALLASRGLRIPATPRGALWSLLFRRARLRLRGLRFRERTQSEVPPTALTLIDTTYSVSTGLGMVDAIRGADFQTRNLLLALAAGEPYRIARAMALEACFAATPGRSGHRRATALLDSAEAIAARIDVPRLEAMVVLTRAICGYLGGHFRVVHDFATTAERLLRERCAGVSWEVANAQLFGVWSLYYLGRLRELSTRVPLLLAQAEERGDLFGSTSQRTGVTSFVWLAADEPVQARRHVHEAAGLWSQQGFHFQHYWNLLAETQIDLYLGEAAAAHQRLEEIWPAVARSLYPRVQMFRVEANHLRARCFLAAAATATDPRPHLRQADRLARRLAGEDAPCAPSLALLLRAGIAAGQGDPAAAVAAATAAAEGFDAIGMALFATVARRARGQLTGGDEGDALVAAADAWMTGQGIRRPDRIAALLTPGFDARSG